jgi:hypothetical protein
VNQRLLAGIRAVAIDAPLPPMQQLRQRMLVVHVGQREHCAVHQATLAVHPDITSQPAKRSGHAVRFVEPHRPGFVGDFGVRMLPDLVNHTPIARTIFQMY